MCTEGKRIPENDRKVCVIYANCQGQGIHRFLLRQREFSDCFEVHHVVNFHLINGKAALPQNLLKSADLFIFQPVSGRYGIYASDSVMSILPDRCRRISFPYIYNDAIWPFAPSGAGPKGQEILLKMRSRGWSDEEIVGHFCDLSLDCEFERRFEASMSTLRSHEQDTTVRVSDYILKEIAEKKLFMTQSHPTSHIFVHCINQIFSSLGYRSLPSSDTFPVNEAGLPQRWPVTPYEIQYYRFAYVGQPDSNWKEFYSREISAFLKQTPVKSSGGAPVCDENPSDQFADPT